MPLGEAYDKKLKSDIADMKNVGGRDGGAVTAAQFLQRFVKPGTPWMHLDIAGTALVKADTANGPKGATGWGVLSLDRMILGFEEEYEAALAGPLDLRAAPAAGSEQEGEGEVREHGQREGPPPPPVHPLED